jgi:hypothetical protein
MVQLRVPAVPHRVMLRQVTLTYAAAVDALGLPMPDVETFRAWRAAAT